MSEPRRIVVLTRAGLGDAVYVIPALRALRRRYPQAHITVITGKRGYPLLQRCPYLDTLYLRHIGNGLIGKLREIIRLRRGHYDLAVILDNSDEKLLHSFLAGIPRRVGGVKRYFGRLLTDPVPVDPNWHQINDLNRAVVARLGCDVSDWRLELFPDPKAEASLAIKLEQAGYRGERPLVGINPGASAPNKRWFPERFAQVADTLLKAGITVMVLGAKSDMPQVEAMRQAMHHPPLVLAGQLSLDELILCLGQLDVLVSGDTGPAHLAAAMGTPVVGLFGPSKARHFAPIGEQHRIIDRSSLCAPTCTIETCHNQRACMRNITAWDVLELIHEILIWHSAQIPDVGLQFGRVLPTNEVPQPPDDDAAPAGRVPP
jgi:lipopolysaccharide heptosyltransferase II